MSDIFAEVEEDLRAERVKRIFQRYGGVMVAAAVLVVLGTAGWKTWSWYQTREAARIATIYVAATDAAEGPADGRKAAATALEQVIAEAHGPAWARGLLGSDIYRVLAELQLAALRYDGGDKPAGLALWDAVAADTATDPVLRDAARLQWALHEVDAGDPAKVQAHLAPLLDPDNPLHALAEEAQGLLALRQGKKDDARGIFKRLSTDVTAPQGVRGRAAGLLAQLGE